MSAYAYEPSGASAGTSSEAWVAKGFGVVRKASPVAGVEVKGLARPKVEEVLFVVIGSQPFLR
jgi:hypothetical protein